MPMSYVARAPVTDESRRMVKAVVKADSGQILGFTCLGVEGGKLMSAIQTVMMREMRWEVLRDAVFAHPSLVKSLNNLWGSWSSVIVCLLVLKGEQSSHFFLSFQCIRCGRGLFLMLFARLFERRVPGQLRLGWDLRCLS